MNAKIALAAALSILFWTQAHEAGAVTARAQCRSACSKAGIDMNKACQAAPNPGDCARAASKKVRECLASCNGGGGGGGNNHPVPIWTCQGLDGSARSACEQSGQAFR